jgi:signal peptidase I
MILVATLFILALALVANAAVLFSSLKVLKAPKTKFTTALLVALISIGIIAVASASYLTKSVLLVDLLGLASFALTAYLYTKFFKVSWGKAIGLWFISGIVSALLISVPTVIVLHEFVFQAFHVSGTAMSPALNDGDYLITSVLEPSLGGKAYVPQRGQIIVFHFPLDTSKIFIKRVVGLPGDHVVISGGKVTIYNKANPNGFNPDVSYEAPSADTLIDTNEIVKPNSVFVLGDNRAAGASYDSRQWGDLPSSDIISVVVYRLEPSFKTY